MHSIASQVFASMGGACFGGNLPTSVFPFQTWTVSEKALDQLKMKNMPLASQKNSLCSLLWCWPRRVAQSWAVFVMSCLTIGLCNRYLEDALSCLFMLSEHATTSWPTLSQTLQCQTVAVTVSFATRSSACGTSIHPNSLIFLSLGGLWRNGVSVFVGLCGGAAFSCHCII